MPGATNALTGWRGCLQVAAYKGKPLYITSTEYGVHQKTSTLSDVWIKAIAYVGPQNVIQFV